MFDLKVRLSLKFLKRFLFYANCYTRMTARGHANVLGFVARGKVFQRFGNKRRYSAVEAGGYENIQQKNLLFDC